MANGYETPEFRRGYEAAYMEIYQAVRSKEHPEVCGGLCRPCGVRRAVIEDTLLALGRLMSEEEFETMVNIIGRINIRLDNGK